MRRVRFSPAGWFVLLLVLGMACGKPPRPRIDGREVAPPEEELPPLDEEGVPYVDEEIPVDESWVEVDESVLEKVEGDDLIRVGLVSGVRTLTLRVLDTVEVLDLSGEVQARGAGPGRLRIAVARRGVTIDGPGMDAVGVAGAGVLLRVEGEGAHFEAKDNEYPGEMLILRGRDGRLTLVNIVDLESYLRGVVPWEIGRPGPESLEAVKAQAIAARSYTVAHLGRRKQLGFDLWDGVGDQVYRGLSGTNELTDRAVRQTRGKVMRYEGRVVQAYYCSTCGGHTASIQDVWPRPAVPYLQGVRDAPRDESAWCRLSPHFRWTVAWSAHQLGDIIRRWLPAEVDEVLSSKDIGVLEGLEVVERDTSGRVHRLRVVTDRGQWEVQGDRIRWLLRPATGRFPILRSTLFTLQEYRDDEGHLIGVRLQGGGFGHGVGMCQSGALAMAQAGRDARQILEHYYRGVRIESLKGGREQWERELP